MDDKIVRIVGLECAITRWVEVRDRLERESRFPCFGYKTKRYVASILTKRIDEDSQELRGLYLLLEKG